MHLIPAVTAPVLAALLLGGCGWGLRRRNLDRWLLSYLRQWPRRRSPRADEEVHLLLCVADHWEPKYQGASPEQARGRVRRWVEGYPQQLARFRDSDGQPPRHTFFYPAEEYEPEYLDALTRLCAAGFGEVEIHLHHDADTAAGLRARLVAFRDLLAQRHGLLGRHRRTGAVGYAFIHGNWALCNSGPAGRYCGVNEEIVVLRDTGCYADLTLPSAPSPAQVAKINSLYYAVDRPGRPRSHETGVDVGTAPQPPGSLLLIQGPLALNWGNRKWGVLPRLENGCLQRTQPPGLDRLRLWLQARVQVPTRPDWYFVKLHCHGTIETDESTLLGEPMARFHAALAEQATRNPRFHYHYVTAREMYNLVRAAEAGWTGSVEAARDYEILAAPALAAPGPGGTPPPRQGAAPTLDPASAGWASPPR